MLYARIVTELLGNTVTSVPADAESADVGAALQELSLRQKRRQYSASLTRNVLSTTSGGSRFPASGGTDGPNSAPAQDFSDDDDDTAAENDNSAGDVDKPDADRVSRPVSKIPSSSAEPEPEPAKTLTNDAEMISFDSHRGMIEQSRALLEQSKARHHALIAQTYSVQRSLRRSGRSLSAFDDRKHQQSSAMTFVPKPPPGDRKTTNTVRTQRLSR